MKTRLDLQKNVGPADRLVRVTAGTALMAVAFLNLVAPFWAVVLAIVGASQVVQGAIGY